MSGYGYVRISDGTTTINLFGAKAGFHLKDWRPSAGGAPKGGGVWQESPFADGRRPVIHKFENITDSFSLAVNGSCMDGVIRDTQELRRLLTKAIQYWTTEWQNEPVWIEARGSAETNSRYAIIYSYSAPYDDNPFEQPFYGGARTVLDDFALAIEHSLWMGTRPGVGECTPIKGEQCWNYPFNLEFNGTTSRLDLGSPAVLDNLHGAAFTAEAWVNARGWGLNNGGRIFDKSGAAAKGWAWFLDPPHGLYGFIHINVTNAESGSGTDDFTIDAEWHHVAMTWDNAADRKVYFYIDGNPVTTYTIQIAGSGAIRADAADNLFIGGRTGADSRSWDGYIGWARISNIVRYSFAFDPPPRCVMPWRDANTIWLGICEGNGATIFDKAIGANNGTATNCTWNGDCCE